MGGSLAGRAYKRRDAYRRVVPRLVIFRFDWCGSMPGVYQTAWVLKLRGIKLVELWFC